jgi:hypothetical protein
MSGYSLCRIICEDLIFAPANGMASYSNQGRRTNVDFCEAIDCEFVNQALGQRGPKRRA